MPAASHPIPSPARACYVYATTENLGSRAQADSKLMELLIPRAATVTRSINSNGPARFQTKRWPVAGMVTISTAIAGDEVLPYSGG